MFINDQQGHIIITVVIEGARVSTSGVNVNQSHLFIKPFLHQQLSQIAYTETQPKTPESKQCSCRKVVARKNSLERQERRKKPRMELGCEEWPVLFSLCLVGIIRVHGHEGQIVLQDVQTFIDDQHGQLAFHSRAFRGRDSRCGGERRGRERGSKQQVWDKVARPVNRSGFYNCRQNSRNWISSTTTWTGDGESQVSSGPVVLRHGHRAQGERERLEN
jgi:hypothetical protein